MMNRRTTAILLGLLAVALVTGIALAKNSANYAIPWDVLGGGGNEMASTGFQVRGTVGQTSIGPASSANYRLGAGYWYGFGPVSIPQNYIYLPVLLKDG